MRSDLHGQRQERDSDIARDSTHHPTDWRESDLHIEDYTVPMASKDKDKDNDDVVSSYLGHGIIRLFRLGGPDSTSAQGGDAEIVPGDDTMMCILAVPTYFTVHDLLHFYIGDEIINTQVANFRILKSVDSTGALNFMVLIKFRDSGHARQFHDTFNGRAFNKVDPEKCHVVPVKEVVFKRGDLFSNYSDTATLPYLLRDPFTSQEQELPQSSVELPTCPVCLDRMDSQTTGLITIPCQHTFHCRCLDKWKNSRCPVCRFSSFRLSRDSLLKQMGDRPKCATCGAAENLWVCLVCGNVGCGRYNSKHAIQHFEDTSHCFAMDVKTQRVWDYAGDNYVHRLVQNEIDGKLVEVGLNVDRTSTTPNDKSTGAVATEFMRNKEYHLEYVQVLVSQLESQREYYEGKMKSDTATQTTVESLEQQVKALQLQLQTSDKTAVESTARAKEADLLIRGLQENLDSAEKQRERSSNKIQQLTAEKTDLQDQVKDLMFYLETQDKFKDATEEERDGAVVIQNPDGTPAGTSKKSKKKKKKKLKIPTLAEIQGKATSKP